MSTAPIDSGGSGGGINRILSHFSTTIPSNSIGTVENSTTPASTVINENNDATWIKTFNHLDRMFSGSLLHLLYRFIDITILLIGLTSNKQTCSISNHLSITSICLLIFYFIDLTIIFPT